MAANEQNQGLMVTVFLGIFFMVIMIILKFMLVDAWVTGIEKQAQTTATKQKELQAKLTEYQDLLTHKADLDQAAEELQRVKKCLPSSVDAPGFMNSLVDILAKTGIIQEEVRPDKYSAFPEYTEIPYSVKAQGHYHAFGQFLTLLEQNPERFMRVKTMLVKNNPKRISIHPIEMQIATFKFNQ